MTNSTTALIALFAVLFTVHHAEARDGHQKKKPPPASVDKDDDDDAPAPTIPADEVLLLDGTKVVGRVEKQEPGQFILIQLADGSEQTINWSAVKSVRLAPGRAAVLEGPPAPPTTPATGEGPVALSPVPTHAINFAIGGVAQLAGLNGAFMLGGGANLSVQGLVGLSAFPGRHGGDFHALRIDAYADVVGGALIANGASAGFFDLGGGAAVGYTYLHMSDLDPVDYKQHGIGVAVMYRVGDLTLWEFAGGQNISSSNLAHGPSIQLLFPRYDARHGALDYAWLGAHLEIVTPSGGGDSVLLYQLGVGTTL